MESSMPAHLMSSKASLLGDVGHKRSAIFLEWLQRTSDPHAAELERSPEYVAWLSKACRSYRSLRRLPSLEALRPSQQSIGEY
mmetsp:Transcript_35601/g.53227  ORF Transcript_35601/g.53227 Transcript_35601/m.53227 type:complete len:83 (-) Transcript_35601:181-429(-)